VNQGSNTNAFVVASFDYLPGMADIDLEYVEVFIQYHAPIGEISLDLISPSGTEVSLLHAVDGNVTGPEAWKTTNSFIADDPIFAGFMGTVSWTYGVNSFRGEDVYGEWQIVMTEVSPNNADGLFNNDGGTLDEFEFTFYGAAPDQNDVYHYTDEVFSSLVDDPARLTLTDANGDDWLNMAAMTENLAINLASDGSGGGSVVGAGAFLVIANGTDIENVVTGDGHDTLLGNDLVNELHGMRGNDTLEGGLDNDMLWGGDGDDYFVFYDGDGADWIGDFTAGVGSEDVIELHGTGFLDFGNLSLAFSDNGVDTTINLGGGDQITLAGLIMGDLDQDDFVFVA
jgi:Ca2+-binding RTX toxin-like protein